MNTYMMALKGGFDNWGARSEAERKEVMSQFAGWAQKLSEEGRKNPFPRLGLPFRS